MACLLSRLSVWSTYDDAQALTSNLEGLAHRNPSSGSIRALANKILQGLSILPRLVRRDYRGQHSHRPRAAGRLISNPRGDKTMRFIMMIKANKDYEAGVPPDPKLLAAIGQYTQEMIKAGVVLATEGLMPSSKGARLRLSDGKLTVIDGPFTEAKELIGGFAIVKASSRKEAIELGSRFMMLHKEALGGKWEGECEIRQLSEYGPTE
jgi:hypothetical protein